MQCERYTIAEKTPLCFGVFLYQINTKNNNNNADNTILNHKNFLCFGNNILLQKKKKNHENQKKNNNVFIFFVVLVYHLFSLISYKWFLTWHDSDHRIERLQCNVYILVSQLYAHTQLSTYYSRFMVIWFVSCLIHT